MHAVSEIEVLPYWLFYEGLNGKLLTENIKVHKIAKNEYRGWDTILLISNVLTINYLKNNIIESLYFQIQKNKIRKKRKNKNLLLIITSKQT